MTEAGRAGAIVAPDGRPARRITEQGTSKQPCPNCNAGPDKRRASGGFGLPHILCAVCGFAWENETP